MENDIDDGDRYAALVAPPSDDDGETLVVMWSVSAAILAVVSLFVAVVIVAMLADRTVRSNPFDLYLIYLLNADFWFSALGFAVCLALAVTADGGYPTDSRMCAFQSWFLVANLTASLWINAVISAAVHRLLRCSVRHRKYYPPTVGTVTRNSLLVYAGAALLASVPLWNSSVTNVDARFGFVCAPVENDRASALFYGLFLFPLGFVVPYVYSVYVFVDVAWGSMLMQQVPEHRRRELAVYFYRIIIVLVLIWGPVLVVVAYGRARSPWVTWAFVVLSHVQGAVSAALCLLKKDVRFAVLNFVTCRGRICTTCKCLTPQADEEAPADKFKVSASQKESTTTAFSSVEEGSAAEAATNTGSSEAIVLPRNLLSPQRDDATASPQLGCSVIIEEGSEGSKTDAHFDPTGDEDDYDGSTDIHFDPTGDTVSRDEDDYDGSTDIHFDPTGDTVSGDAKEDAPTDLIGTMLDDDRAKSPPDSTKEKVFGHAPLTSLIEEEGAGSGEDDVDNDGVTAGGEGPSRFALVRNITGGIHSMRSIFGQEASTAGPRYGKKCRSSLLDDISVSDDGCPRPLADGGTGGTAGETTTPTPPPTTRTTTSRFELFRNTAGGWFGESSPGLQDNSGSPRRRSALSMPALLRTPTMGTEEAALETIDVYFGGGGGQLPHQVPLRNSQSQRTLQPPNSNDSVIGSGSDDNHQNDSPPKPRSLRSSVTR